MAIYTHLTLGTNDLAKSIAFYDAALGALGINRLGARDTAAFWGVDAPELIVLKPADGKPASYANGGTIGFKAASRAAVDAFHAGAMANGGKDEGAPGPRAFAPNAYAAYCRDPDGNKLVAVCHAPE